MTQAITRALSIKAGRNALRRIREEGFGPHLFSTIVGASGGPKWLALYGLDQVLAERWLARPARAVSLIGSSIGSWRHACLAQENPRAALDRFLEAYLEQRYGSSPSARDVSQQAAAILDHVLDETGAAEILSRSDLASHVVTARCRGMLASERPTVQGIGLGLAATCNFMSRRTLGMHFQRVLFHTGKRSTIALRGISTQGVQLTEHNLRPVLMASGAIPLVLAGVRDISGAPPGTYRDGGMVDYHFDFEMTWPEGLCLFPHFSDVIVPGWFDKNVPWRRLHGPLLDDVVLLSPSADLVRQWPYGKIPDRKDFSSLRTAERIAYWKHAVDDSRRVGDALSALMDDPDPARFMAAL